MRISDWSSDVCSSDLPEFLAKNPNGRVPVIEREDGSLLAESNAILCWLADGTAYFAGDAWQRAQALGWMFFEQYSHEPHIAVARFIRGWTPEASPRRASELPRRSEEHTSELQSLMRNSYAVFCLKKKRDNERMR